MQAFVRDKHKQDSPLRQPHQRAGNRSPRAATGARTGARNCGDTL
jgi:hypothetical protein